MVLKLVCGKCGAEDTQAKNFMYIRCHELVEFDTYKTQPESKMYICRKCYKKVFKKDMV